MSFPENQENMAQQGSGDLGDELRDIATENLNVSPEKLPTGIEMGDMVVLNQDGGRELANGPFAEALLKQGIDPKEMGGWLTVVGSDSDPNFVVVGDTFGKIAARIPKSFLRKVPREEYDKAVGSESPYEKSKEIHGRDVGASAQ